MFVLTLEIRKFTPCAHRDERKTRKNWSHHGNPWALMNAANVTSRIVVKIMGA